VTFPPRDEDKRPVIDYRYLTIGRIQVFRFFFRLKHHGQFHCDGGAGTGRGIDYCPAAQQACSFADTSKTETRLLDCVWIKTHALIADCNVQSIFALDELH
jgi:hypothetical protein